MNNVRAQKSGFFRLQNEMEEEERKIAEKRVKNVFAIKN